MKSNVRGCMNTAPIPYIYFGNRKTRHVIARYSHGPVRHGFVVPVQSVSESGP